MKKYDLVFLSPHLDDVVLSCGGFLIKQKRLGKKMLVITIFSGVNENFVSNDVRKYVRLCGFNDPKSLGKERKKEDRSVYKYLNIDYKWLNEIEADYRGETELVYKSHKEIRTEMKTEDEKLLVSLNRKIKKLVRKYLKDGGEVYCPLALGGHVDHKITHIIGVNLTKDCRVFFWEDYPYKIYFSGLFDLKQKSKTFKADRVIDIDDVITEKRMLIGRYKSQIGQLFKYKQQFLSSREIFYKQVLEEKNNRWIHFVADELEGGGKVANDYVIKRLFKLGKRRLMVYEQVPVQITGILSQTRKLIWSIANFFRYINRCVDANSIVVTTSPNLFIAFKMFSLFKKKNIFIWFYCHADRGTPRPVGVRKLIFWLVYGGLERLSVGSCVGIIAPSTIARDLLLRKYRNRRIKFFVVKNGVDRKVFSSTQPVINNNIMYCGRIDPVKNIDKLIEAFDNLGGRGVKKAHLTIVAPKVDKENLGYLNKIKKMTSREISFMFDLKKEDIAIEYKKNTCVVLPSETESFSLVLLEALACGSLFIGHKTGEVGRLLRKLDKKLLLSSRESWEITDKIIYVFGLDEIKRKKLFKRSQRLLAEYDWDKTAKQIFDLVNSYSGFF